MIEKCVIYIPDPYTGLGDHLQFSTIPEIARDNNIPCYLSKHNATRNSEVFDLLWKHNPHIDTDNLLNETSNLFFDLEEETFQLDKMNSGTVYESFIENTEKLLGVKPVHKLPKIYYDYSSPISGYPSKSYVLIDFYSLYQQRHKNYKNKKSIKRHLRKFYKNNPDYEYIFVTNKHNKTNKNKNYIIKKNKVPINNIKVLKVDSIFQYCHLIKNCAHYFTVQSGGHALASAILQNTNDFSIDCFIPYNQIVRCRDLCNAHLFHNVNYITV